MKQLKALVLSPDMMDLRVRNWNFTQVRSAEEAIEKMHAQPYRMVAVAEAVAPVEYLKLKRVLAITAPETAVFRFTGSETLGAEIQEARRSAQPTAGDRRYLDNSFEIALAGTLNLN